MKRYTTAIIIALVFSIFMACGSSGGTTAPAPVINTPAPTPTPVPDGMVGFSCLSVDNDNTCTGIEDAPGIWNSGPIATSGTPMPVDFMNLKITNNSDDPVSVFAYTMVTISGCGDNPIAFDAVDLAPGESAAFTYTTYNVRCGALGYQETLVSLYNAAGFNPTDYANPWTYPRTDLILDAVVHWENRLPGDMP